MRHDRRGSEFRDFEFGRAFQGGLEVSQSISIQQRVWGRPKKDAQRVRLVCGPNSYFNESAAGFLELKRSILSLRVSTNSLG
jgi:hypothetical protein